jgi:alkylhydroperoxidase/carboxymuconolactone decarboxylase family protein YurZ
VATGAGDLPSAYRRHLAEALGRGVTADEVAGVLTTLLPVVGTARVTAAASAIRAALDRAWTDGP